MYHVGLLQVEAPTAHHIVLTRAFDAPPALLFDAMTRPDLLTCWLGPGGWSLDVCEVNLTVGGRYRFRARGPCGTTIRWHGVYLELAPGERIVQTESYEDWNADESLVTTRLSAHNGTTTITTSVRYPTEQLRDAVLNCGMLRGLAEGYDKLAALLCVRLVA